jgi:hypothetical protein
MASTVALGDWVQGSEKYLVAELKKSTAGSSAIARGKVIGLSVATAGVWAVAPTSFVGKTGICTHTNIDSDAQFTGLVGGGRGYVTADGPIKPHEPVQVSGSTAGEVVQYTVATIATTPTQANVQDARDQMRKIVGFYKGHKDEGDGGTGRLITDAADGDVIKIELVRSQ